MKILKINSNSKTGNTSHMIDGSDDTCWFSDGTKNLFVDLEMDVAPASLKIEFQRGFQPKIIEVPSLDINYSLKANEDSVVISNTKKLTELKMLLGESYDPYNRICIYHVILN